MSPKAAICISGGLARDYKSGALMVPSKRYKERRSFESPNFGLSYVKILGTGIVACLQYINKAARSRY